MKLGELPLVDMFATQLTLLKELNLSKNNLFNGDILFAALVHLKHLRKLNVSENYLNGPLSAAACELTGLEELRLDSNRITLLPQGCSTWSELKVLTVSNNNLISLPEQGAAWSELTFLNIKNNKITDISGELIKFWEKVKFPYCILINAISIYFFLTYAAYSWSDSIVEGIRYE